MESAQATKPEAKAAGQSRSTVEFPYNDLDAAVEVAKGVHNAGGTACESEQLAAQLKMEASGGGYRMRVNGAQTFGLVSYERGGRVVLTDIGRAVVDAGRERSARVLAFLAVPLYSKVYDEFKGSPLPPPPALERAMIAIGVGQKVADRARQVMMRSAKQAGFFDSAPDRLVKPSIRDDGGAKGEPGSDKSAVAGGAGGGSGTGSGGAGAGGGDHHPLIQGLLVTLPKPGEPWSASDRANWLTLANTAFKMIYKVNDTDGDVTVTFKPRGAEKQEH